MSSQLGTVEGVPHAPFLQIFSTPAIMRSMCIVEEMPQGVGFCFLFFNPHFADLFYREIRRLQQVGNVEGRREGLWV